MQTYTPNKAKAHNYSSPWMQTSFHKTKAEVGDAADTRLAALIGGATSAYAALS